ncbi:hypothetical protein ON010_g7129 [Phytophthora cinnamomi]|nr:hypothetical protein ON010_g7129 [Phytophthora cinnamomi]
MKNTGSVAFANPANRLPLGLKYGVWNVIDAMSLELNGKSIISMSEYKLFANNFRAQTEASLDYVQKHRAESFLYPDSSGSMVFSSAATTKFGDGYSNVACDITAALQTAATGAGVLPANEGFIKRLLSNPPTAGSQNTNVWTWCFRPWSASAGSVAGSWNYMLKIRLVDLHPTFMELDLMANPRIRVRLRINQGSSVITIGSGFTATNTMSLASTSTISGTTCPIMVSSSAGSAPISAVIPAATVAAPGQTTVALGRSQQHS